MARMIIKSDVTHQVNCFYVEANCEQCSNQFKWQESLIARGESGGFGGTEWSKNLSIARSESEMNNFIKTIELGNWVDFKVVPCPKCGHIQKWLADQQKIKTFGILTFIFTLLFAFFSGFSTHSFIFGFVAFVILFSFSCLLSRIIYPSNISKRFKRRAKVKPPRFIFKDYIIEW